MGIFKAYDIRGLVPSELDAGLAYKIGNAFARFLGAGRLLVGRDMRVHSEELAGAVIEGMRDAGTDVVSIGLASTPMTYFAIGSQSVDGGLCVTASHNPGEYNGMKLCGPGARPISAANGILDLERMCAESIPTPTKLRGKLEELELLSAYADHVASFADMDGEVKLAIDAANGMAGYTLPAILERVPKARATTLFMEPDGTFPNHEANPIKERNLDPVRELVLAHGSHLGVGFDGDADRCSFVDEAGHTVPPDLMTALLAREILAHCPGSAIVYDLRSSWVVKEVIREAGGVPVKDRVGHSFIKATMRERDAVFAGELSGHFYFKDNFTTDSGVIAMVSVLNLLASDANRGRPFSELVQDLRRYHATGEINFVVEDKAAAIALLERTYSDGRQDDLDGITVEFGELGDPEWWWFNVRLSNTEPLLRLNLEASSAALREAKRDELVGLLGEPEA
ncbi:MAG: phosphomannomutase/phosphoglucomutase [Planctomycetota bacterium]|nr:MAG: phosphomannomutase/phosphoglucomutase [Planctomycetota bacterium]